MKSVRFSDVVDIRFIPPRKSPIKRDIYLVSSFPTIACPHRGSPYCIGLSCKKCCWDRKCARHNNSGCALGSCKNDFSSKCKQQRCGVHCYLDCKYHTNRLPKAWYNNDKLRKSITARYPLLKMGKLY